VLTWGQTGTMMGAWKARFRRRVSKCLARSALKKRNSCTMRSSLRAEGVRDVCTKKWAVGPVRPDHRQPPVAAPVAPHDGASAPKRSSFTACSGGTSCTHTSHERNRSPNTR